MSGWYTEEVLEDGREIIAYRRLTLEEAKPMVAAWIKERKALVASVLADSGKFLVSSSNVVHTSACPTMREHIEVDNHWAVAGDPLSVGEQIDGGCMPRFPDIVTRADLVEKPRKRCKVCCPDVPERPKREAPTTRAGNVSRAHIGRKVGGVEVVEIRITPARVVLALDDGEVLRFGVEDRITFDPIAKPAELGS